MQITIPADVRASEPWAGARHVEIEYNPPYLIVRPLRIEELLRRPRSEDEEFVPDEAAHPQP